MTPYYDRDTDTVPRPTRKQSEERAELAPSVDVLLSAWPMKRFAFKLDRRMHDCVLLLGVLTLVTLLLGSVVLIAGQDTFFTPRPRTDSPADNPAGGVSGDTGTYPFADGKTGAVLLPWADSSQVIQASAIRSSYAVLADIASGQVIASRKADESIYPASMTKVMTLIIVAENLPREECLKETITISQEVYDRMQAAQSSGIDLKPGETLTVEALLYALMLRSDGIAACELARYVAGSEEDFVELMNQKAEKMGLAKTHFVNPTGLYHKDHVSSARDMATIMAYAMSMRLPRQVLKTQSYTASCVGADGKTFNYYLYHNLIVTQFDKIQPNQPNTVTVVAGKTGFTDESEYCLVTYAEAKDGHGYVCVTAKGDGYPTCISDYITIYNNYVKP